MSLVRVKVMLIKVLNTRNYFKLLFSTATLLIFLDSYQVFNIPLTWAGNSLLTAICLVIYKKENMKLDLLISTIIFLTLIKFIQQNLKPKKN
mgnify:CR=1 FL=1